MNHYSLKSDFKMSNMFFIPLLNVNFFIETDILQSLIACLNFR
jgi:hypothetical protein